jgi:hypothetical protein
LQRTLKMTLMSARLQDYDDGAAGLACPDL